MHRMARSKANIYMCVNADPPDARRVQLRVQADPLMAVAAIRKVARQQQVSGAQDGVPREDGQPLLLPRETTGAFEGRGAGEGHGRLENYVGVRAGGKQGQQVLELRVLPGRPEVLVVTDLLLMGARWVEKVGSIQDWA